MSNSKLYDFDKNKKLFLAIDCNAIVHRAYHAYPSTLATSTGQQVNAVYGFTAMLLEALRKFDPDYVLATYDTRKPTFRHEKYPDYKGTRKPTDPELIEQFPLTEKVLGALNIPIQKKEGFEADDLLGSIAHKVKEGEWSKQNLELVVLSGDKDLLQLVDDGIEVCLPVGSFKDLKVYDKDAVYEKIGVYPDQIADFKAIVGDSSDNIPGVKGVGEKTAKQLLGEFYTLGGIYESLGQVKKRQANLLDEGREQARLSKELAQIRGDVDIDVRLEDCLLTDFDLNEVVELFAKFEFKSLVPKIPGGDAVKARVNSEASLVHSQKSLFSKPKKAVKEQELQMADLEYLKNNIEMISRVVCFYSEESEIRTEKEFNANSSENYPEKFVANREELFDGIGVFYARFETEKDTHNGYVVIHTAENAAAVRTILCNIDCETTFYGWEDYVSRTPAPDLLRRANIHDVKLMGHYLSAGEKSFDLPALAFKWINEYIPEDAEYTDIESVLNLVSRIAQRQKEILDSGDFLKECDFVMRLENDTSVVLGRMENVGLRVDFDYLLDLEEEIGKQLEEVKKQVFHYVGHEFNPDSPKQVAEVLYDELGIDELLPKKGRSTKESVLQKVKDAHPFVPEFLKYRNLSKMKNTYVTGFVSLLTNLYREENGNYERADITPDSLRRGNHTDADFYIFTNFLQTGSASGRLSSQNPNLQNIPVQGDWAGKFRNIFIPREGCKLVSIDYSQIEYRLVADFSRDEKLISYFESGADIHRATASGIFDIDEDEVTDDQRRVGKVVNFGILYGQTAYGLAKQLDISVENAKNYIDKYFKKYEKVAQYLERVKEDAQSRGFVETIIGRRRYIGGLTSNNRFLKEASVREAINTPIQGSASDLMKVAMIRADGIIRDKFKGQARMLLQVHDELIFEVETDKLGQFEKEITDALVGAGEELGVKVPLEVHFSSGDTMAELK